jgi:hypothetical protein
MTRAITRAFFVWLLMMIAESVHGTLRRFFLTPYVGDFRARQIGAVVGSAIILALAYLFIAYLFIEWIGAKDTGALWAVGVMWFAMSLVFEFTLGRFAFGYTWQRILEDYDLSKGGLLLFGVVWMAFSPMAASGLRCRPVRATSAERVRDLPGDELIAAPIGSLTHAITIRRPSSRCLSLAGSNGRGPRWLV